MAEGAKEFPMELRAQSVPDQIAQITGTKGDFVVASEVHAKSVMTPHFLYREKVPKFDALWITIGAVSHAFR
jgi:hypothetical protein